MPPNRREIADYLATLTDQEYAALAAESRGGHWRDTIPAKSVQLGALIANTTGNGYQRPAEEATEK